MRGIGEHWTGYRRGSEQTWDDRVTQQAWDGAESISACMKRVAYQVSCIPDAEEKSCLCRRHPECDSGLKREAALLQTPAGGYWLVALGLVAHWFRAVDRV